MADPDDYATRRAIIDGDLVPRVEVEKLRSAGIRLAALLDETLSSAPGTVNAGDVDAALERWDALVDASRSSPYCEPE